MSTTQEHDAFLTAVIYHFRKGMAECACGPLPLGSSFAEHQWEVYQTLLSSFGAESTENHYQQKDRSPQRYLPPDRP